MTRVSRENVRAPQYRRAPGAGQHQATFEGGVSVDVAVGRARRYPGLHAPAPDTTAIYALAAESLAGAQHVVDWGAGAGAGTAELLLTLPSVVALDADATAVAFARAYLRDVSVVHDDGRTDAVPEASFDAACVIDVLGQCASPARVLRQLRRALQPGARVFVAEPRSYPAQALLAPVRSAFSPRELERALVEAGFEIDAWRDDIGHFVACVARASADTAYEHLSRADAALDRGDVAAALEAYAALPADAPRALRVAALLGRARVHRASGDLESTATRLLEAANIHPRDGHVLAGLAEVALLSGDGVYGLELAVRALEADACDPVHVRALGRLAGALEQQDAYAAWRIASGLCPAHLESAVELSRAAAQRGELPYAIWVLERLRDYHTDLDAAVHETLSWLYLTAERVDDARLEAALAQVKAPESSSVAELCAHIAAQAAAA